MIKHAVGISNYKRRWGGERWAIPIASAPNARMILIRMVRASESRLKLDTDVR